MSCYTQCTIHSHGNCGNQGNPPNRYVLPAMGNAVQPGYAEAPTTMPAYHSCVNTGYPLPYNAPHAPAPLADYATSLPPLSPQYRAFNINPRPSPTMPTLDFGYPVPQSAPSPASDYNAPFQPVSSQHPAFNINPRPSPVIPISDYGYPAPHTTGFSSFGDLYDQTHPPTGGTAPGFKPFAKFRQKFEELRAFRNRRGAPSSRDPLYCYPQDKATASREYNDWKAQHERSKMMGGAWSP